MISKLRCINRKRPAIAGLLISIIQDYDTNVAPNLID